MNWRNLFKKPGKNPDGYPRGYVMDFDRPDVFDPALKHYPRGFVKGEPARLEPSERQLFLATRGRVMQACLDGLSSSPLRKHLIVRGSITMERWFGARARTPKDIDLVVRPDEMKPDDPQAQDLLLEIKRSVIAGLSDAQVTVGHEVATDAIWTYERAEGRRLTFAWQVDGRFQDSLQVDVVFGQWTSSYHTYRYNFRHGQLAFASPSVSLEWKMQWLTTDRYPQGKDLYDAVLLAESTPYPGQVSLYKEPTFIDSDSVDWDNFKADYPQLATGTAAEWVERLRQALREEEDFSIEGCP